MDWQTSEDTVAAEPVTESDVRLLRARPPATGAWRDGDHPGNRQFFELGSFTTEGGEVLPDARLAYETWGTLNADASNAILINHALTGDSHVVGDAGPGHATSGWWGDLVGPGLVVDTDKFFVVAANMLGGCQGSTGPASISPDGYEWAGRFAFLTIRDHVHALGTLSDSLGIQTWFAAIGGSTGGMHTLEFGIEYPDRVSRLAILCAPALTSADQIALNDVQLEAIVLDPRFRDGEYYDAPDGEGPHRGLSLARRIAMLSYRSNTELNRRFARSWQSDISPIGRGGRYAVESYLDFHGNKFTRRFDANSYVTLVGAMNSHDVGRGRGGIDAALGRVEASVLVLGVDTDRLFPVDGQHQIAAGVRNSVSGPQAIVIESDFGHDGFLIETDVVGRHLSALLAL